MFFRREPPKKLTFPNYLNKLRAAGFNVEQDGSRARVSRNGVAAVIEAVPDSAPSPAPRVIERAGMILGDEIAKLVDGGYQKFLQTPSGKRKPALAGDLRAIHNFQEDLREALGLVSLYNESLGTVSNQYIYDRVEDRDKNVPKKPWEIATTL